jgi:hypothetical protein
VYDFCGRTHADAFRNLQMQTYAQTASSAPGTSYPGSSGTTSYNFVGKPVVQGQKLCAMKGCSEAVHVDVIMGVPRLSDYCRISHKRACEQNSALIEHK